MTDLPPPLDPASAAARLAWFSPLPPSASGIAAYSADLLPRLAARGYAIDTYTDQNVHGFVWRQRRRPYDLTVYQLGNATCHDYMWAYLFRYPGMVVLHDAQLHQARALFLTRRWRPRREDYLAEFRANHPGAPADAGELVVAGLGTIAYQHWPMIRLVLDSARLNVVHNRRLLDDLRERFPHANLGHVEMGVPDPLADFAGAERCPPSADAPRPARSARLLREAFDLGDDAIVVAAFGGVTAEKRLRQLFSAVGAIADRHPNLHLVLVGAEVSHFDARAEARTWQVGERVHFTGFVPDHRLADWMLAADICACLRWPTNGETSASWLRCLAAGRPTIITNLSHLVDVPTLDPRGWRVWRATPDAAEPVAVAIDLLDEGLLLQLALERLATDAALRSRLGRAGRAWWHAHHRLDAMADGYQPLIARAMATPPPDVTLPSHLLDDATAHARGLAATLGVIDLVDEALGPARER